MSKGTQSAADRARLIGAGLLDVLRDGESPGDLWPEVVTGPDAPAFIEAAERHRIAPVVRHVAQTHRACWTAMAPAVRLALDGARASATVAHLQVTGDLPAMSRALDDRGVPWLVMKGPVVATLGYPTPSVRGYGDLDVVVPPAAFGSAVSALERAGALLIDQNWSLQLSAWRSETTLILPGGTFLDLHWHPVNERHPRNAFRFDVAAAVERRRFVAVPDGLRVPAFDAVDNLLTVALHAALAGGHRLVWVADVNALARYDAPDWDDLVRRAGQYRIGLPVGAILQRARRLLAAPVPTEVIDALVGGRRWTSPWIATERLATPHSLGRGTRTGRFVISSLRSSASSNAQALAAELVGHVRSAIRPTPPPETNPLSTPTDDVTRRAYLTAVEAFR